MPAVTLKAHYDGERIQLDEPFDIPPNTPLMVTVLSGTVSVVGDDWVRRARESLAAAYGPDEPEYTTSEFLAVLPVGSFLGSIGAIDGTRHGRLLKRLADHLLAEAASSTSPQ